MRKLSDEKAALISRLLAAEAAAVDRLDLLRLMGWASLSIEHIWCVADFSRG